MANLLREMLTTKITKITKDNKYFVFIVVFVVEIVQIPFRAGLLHVSLLPGRFYAPVGRDDFRPHVGVR